MCDRIVKVVLPVFLCIAGLVASLTANLDADGQEGQIARVLLLSVDGLHAFDLSRYVENNPNSPLAQLTATGRTYTNASATRPSDSFPGMLAMVTGGTPRSTGVYYDDGYDRTLAVASGACVPGARVQWKQNLDFTPLNFPSFSAFSLFWSGVVPITIDSAKLPRDPADGCATRVLPHQFPRVNNVFELLKDAGGRTAWADKHPAYEFLNGPSGAGIDDLYTPEIATTIGVAPPPPVVITNSFSNTMAHDDMKVAAILNQINGFDHTGTAAVGVPTLFGMNFQAVSVGQKLSIGGVTGGYIDESGTPSVALQTALVHTDQSIGAMVSALSARGLLDSTLIIISAKHGNSPVDLSSLVRVDPAKIMAIVNTVPPGLALLSADTGPLIWLRDQSTTAAVVAALNDPTNKDTVRIDQILWGPDLAALYPDPLTDARTPDIILLPKPGTVYTTSATKIADHGGFSEDDVHVALLVSNPSISQRTIDMPVETRQIACTILKALEMSCNRLMSEDTEPSRALPNSNRGSDN